MSTHAPRPPHPPASARPATDLFPHPRPVPAAEVVAARPDRWQERYAALVRGMTGLRQVSGRSDLSREESVLPDLRYVENWTIALDAEILVRTVHAMVRGDGAY